MRKSLLAMMILLVSAPFAPGQGRDRAVRFDPVGCVVSFCAESGWIADNNATNHTTVWRHGLRATPRVVTVLFSPDPAAGTVYQVAWSMASSASGNPVTIETDNRTVKLHISNTLPLHGIWSPETDWRKFAEGYWKIVVYR